MDYPVGEPHTGEDEDKNDTLTYTIVEGNVGHAFKIESLTGQISVNTTSALDFETRNVFYLRVMVTDDAAAPLTDSCIVTVRLTDVNEPPTLNDVVIELDENSAVGETVGAPLERATVDVDAGDIHTYLISGGNE